VLTREQELIKIIIASANELSALQEAVLPISPPAPVAPPGSDKITIGDVTFPIITSPFNSVFVVDPRPLLALNLYEWQKHDHSKSFECNQRAILRKIGKLDWELETTHHGKYPNALHFGRWMADVHPFTSHAKFVASAYFIDDKWIMYFQAAIRNTVTVFTPFEADKSMSKIINTCGPYRGMPLAELRVPPMSACHGRFVLNENPPPHNKCEAHPRIYKGKAVPCLSFAAAWEGGNEVSEGILQMV